MSSTNSQHSKTWLLDNELYIDGSANFTGQSSKNEESIVVTRVRSVIYDATSVFRDVWAVSTEVPMHRLLTLPEYQRSASQSARRSASLSVEKRF